MRRNRLSSIRLINGSHRYQQDMRGPSARDQRLLVRSQNQHWLLRARHDRKKKIQKLEAVAKCALNRRAVTDDLHMNCLSPWLLHAAPLLFSQHAEWSKKYDIPSDENSRTSSISRLFLPHAANVVTSLLSTRIHLRNRQCTRQSHHHCANATFWWVGRKRNLGLMMKRGTGPTIRAGRHDQPFQSLPSQQAKTTVSQPWNNKRKRDLPLDAGASTLRLSPCWPRTSEPVIRARKFPMSNNLHRRSRGGGITTFKVLIHHPL